MKREMRLKGADTSKFKNVLRSNGTGIAYLKYVRWKRKKRNKRY